MKLEKIQANVSLEQFANIKSVADAAGMSLAKFVKLASVQMARRIIKNSAGDVAAACMKYLVDGCQDGSLDPVDDDILGRAMLVVMRAGGISAPIPVPAGPSALPYDPKEVVKFMQDHWRDFLPMVDKEINGDTERMFRQMADEGYQLVEVEEWKESKAQDLAASSKGAKMVPFWTVD